VRVIGRRCRVTRDGVTLLPDPVLVLEPSGPGG